MLNSTAITSFKEHEKIFKQRTGNDFSFYYKKYYPKLIYYTSKMCKDQQKAEDSSSAKASTEKDTCNQSTQNNGDGSEIYRWVRGVPVAASTGSKNAYMSQHALLF